MGDPTLIDPVEPEVTIYISTFTLSILPEDHDDAGAFAVQVQRLLNDRWRVYRLGQYLQSNGTWKSWQWASFDHDEAIRRAREALPLIKVNGKTALDVLAVPGDDNEAPASKSEDR